MPVRLNQDDLQIIKKLELQICIEIDRICTKYDILYSIAFGTLLGAVRHEGFIPWDDDIDVAMLRSEYDKFLNVAKSELDDKYEIVNYETNSCVGEPFTKVMLKGTVMLERFAKNAGAPCGVFVDVFPYDNAPNGTIKRLIHRFTNYQLRKRILLDSKYDFGKEGLKKVLYEVIRLSAKGKKRKLIRKYRNNQCRYNGIVTRDVVALGGNYGYKRDTIPRLWFDQYRRITFEGIELNSIEAVEDFLQHYYGDYMKLPPIEQRINKHTVEVLDLTEFGGRKVGDLSYYRK